jgi:hypothetical protein
VNGKVGGVSPSDAPAFLTNSAGEVYLTNLLPGTYRIEIEKPGFKKLVRPDVFLHVSGCSRN